MEVPIPYSIYSKVSEKTVVWENKRKCARDHSNAVQVQNAEIIAGGREDYIHLNVAIPPKISMPNFMGYLKGKSTLVIYDRHPELQSKWNKSFWAREYYVETIGNITEEAVKKYINEQGEDSRKEDMRSSAL